MCNTVLNWHFQCQRRKQRRRRRRRRRRRKKKKKKILACKRNPVIKV
jgi:hypothetical protein